MKTKRMCINTSGVYNKSLRREPLTCRTHNQACLCCVTREEGDSVIHKPAKGLALGWRPRRVVVLFILVHPNLRSPPGVPAGTQTHNTCSDALMTVLLAFLQAALMTVWHTSAISASLNCRCICKWGQTGRWDSLACNQTRYLYKTTAVFPA